MLPAIKQTETMIDAKTKEQNSIFKRSLDTTKSLKN